MHLSDGTLRRWLDEPLAVDAVKRRHLDACERCQRHVASVRADADRVEAALAVPTPAVDAAMALVRMQAGVAIAGPPVRRRFTGVRWGADPRRRARLARWSAAGVCAVAVSGALVISGAAQGLITIFQPRQFSPVSVTSGDIRSLAGLATYGNVTGVPTFSVQPASSAAAASAYAGVTVLAPADLPAAVPATPRYAVIPGSVVSFTFDAAKAAAAARSRGATLPPMPAGIDGTTLTLSVPPGLIESYGADVTSLLSGGPAALNQPALVILEARIPSITSTGATAAQLEDYLLAQPGIPPDLAAEIRAVGNPSGTLPVPIPIDRASAQQVTIAGVPGLLIGDSTGIASLVLWQRSGVVYAVAGSLTSDQLLAVAGSLR